MAKGRRSEAKVQKLKGLGEGGNPLYDRVEDKGSARAETRGISEQQAGSEGAVRMSNAYMPPWAPMLQVYFRPCRTLAGAFLGRLRVKHIP